MTFRKLLAALALICLSAVSAAAQSNGGITVKTNISYGPNLLLDVYFPPAGFVRPRPAMMEIHGGGWMMGSRNGPYDVMFSQALAKAGYVTFNVEYRLVKPSTNGQPVENPYPAPFDDCQRAVRWVRRHAADYGVDPNRVGAIGGSAGGHLVALLGAMDTRDNSDPELAPYSSRVQAVVDYFGPADLTKPFPTNNLGGISVQDMVDNLVGKGNVKHEREASPIFAIDDKTVPFLIFQGDVDALVPVDQSRELAAALKKAGRDVTYVELPGEGHGFSKLKDQTETNEKTLEFLQRTIGGK